MKKFNSFKTCAHYVRRTTCERCLYRRQCEKEGAPVSNLGRLYYDLRVMLPTLQRRLRESCAIKKLHLALSVPDINEIEQDASAVIAIRYGSKESLCRVPLDGSESEAEIYDKIIRGYAAAYAKRKARGRKGK